jgi:hypothetical protein
MSFAQKTPITKLSNAKNNDTKSALCFLIDLTPTIMHTGVRNMLSKIKYIENASTPTE